MSIYDVNSADPLQQFADRSSKIKEYYEVVRTVFTSGRAGEHYRLEVVKRLLEASAKPAYYYSVFAYVEDIIEVKRTVGEDEVIGTTLVWTRWTSFPAIRATESDDALEQALTQLNKRIQ